VGFSDTVLDEGPWEDLGVKPPSQNMQLQIAAATWRIEMRSWVNLLQRAIPLFARLL